MNRSGYNADTIARSLSDIGMEIEEILSCLGNQPELGDRGFAELIIKMENILPLAERVFSTGRPTRAHLDELQESLRKIAEDVAKDIKGDNPEADVNYDLYVDYIDGDAAGMIDMGEWFQRAYNRDPYTGEWREDTLPNPVGVKNRILEERAKR
jgi:hypothetical protein